jgi:predicted nucleotide-binding protein (sugar kinase/HSP70/actin superfamily)
MLSFLNNKNLENKNYTLITNDGFYVVEFSCPLVQLYLDLIKDKINNMAENDIRFIKIPDDKSTICGEQLLEISWD